MAPLTASGTFLVDFRNKVSRHQNSSQQKCISATVCSNIWASSCQRTTPSPYTTSRRWNDQCSSWKPDINITYGIVHTHQWSHRDEQNLLHQAVRCSTIAVRLHGTTMLKFSCITFSKRWWKFGTKIKDVGYVWTTTEGGWLCTALQVKFGVFSIAEHEFPAVQHRLPNHGLGMPTHNDTLPGSCILSGAQGSL